MYLIIEDVPAISSTTLSVRGAPLSVSENDWQARVTLELSAPLSSALEVTVSSLDGTATAGRDYSALNQTVTLQSGTNSYATFLYLLDDIQVEGDEQFSLVLSVTSPPPGLILESPVLVNIRDDDVATLGFATAAPSFSEGAGDVSIGLALSAALPADLEVAVSSSDGSATAGSDYTMLSETVTIAKGQTSASVTLSLIEDTAVEPDETLTLTLSASAAGLTVAPAETVTVTDNDVATLGFANTPLSFSEGTGDVSIGLVLSGMLPEDLVVTVSSSDGTATAGSDYTALSDTITISKGQTSASVTLSLIEDTVVEPEETLTLTLSATADRLTVSGAATVTLTDNDTGGITSTRTGSITMTEGDSVSYSLVLDAEPSGNVTITPSSDSPLLVSVTGSLTFTSGDWSTPQTVTVEALRDNDVADGTATISYAVSGNDDATLADLYVRVKDIPGAVTDLGAVAGYGSVALTWTNPGDSDLASVSIAYGEDSVSVDATAGAEGSHGVTGLAGATEYTFVARSVDSDGNTSAPVSVTVTTPAVPVASMYIGSPGTSSGVIAEGGAGVTVTLALDRPAPQDVTVTLVASAGAGYASADDVSFGSGVTAGSSAGVYSVTVAKGVSSSSFTVTAVHDDETDPHELLNLAIRDGADYNVGSGNAVYLMIEDTPVSASTLSVRGVPLSVSEGDGNVSVTLELTAALFADLEVTVSSLDGTAVAGSDYTALDETVTIAVGDTSATVTLVVTDDDIVEHAEQMSLVLSVASALYGLTLDSPALVNISDDDSATLGVRGVPLSVSEGDGDVNVTLELSAALAADLEVTVSSLDGTAVAGSDYTALAETVTIAVGDTRATVTLVVTDDDIVEHAEQMSLVLSVASAPSGLTLDSPALVNISDDDSATLGVRGAPLSVSEGDGNVSVMLELSAALAADLEVTVSSLDGTAVAGSDYTTLGETVTIRGGTTSATVTLALLQDDIIEGDEQLSLVLSAAAAPSGLTLDSPALVNISDDDSATLGVRGAPLSVSEGDGNVSVTLELSAALAADLELTVSSSDVTATAGSDYTTLGETVTIRGGATSATVTLALLQDDIIEGDEQLSLVLSAAAAPSGLVLDSPALVNISDDDSATLSVRGAPLRVSEGDGNVDVTLELSKAFPKDLEVTVSSLDGSAIAGSDYTALNESVTISTGVTSATVSLALLQDELVEHTEQLSLVLSVASAPSGLVLDSPALVKISDDDSATLRVKDDPLSLTEGDGEVAVKLELSAALAADLEVTVSSIDGTATAGSDYTALAQAVTIAAGNTSATVMLEVLQDEVAERREQLRLVLVATDPPSGLSLDYLASVSISDPVGKATLRFGAIKRNQNRVAIKSLLVREVQPDDKVFAVAVILNRPLSGDIEVTVNAVDGTATSGSDYELGGYDGQGGFVPAAGRSFVFTVRRSVVYSQLYFRIVDDAIDEGTETFELSMVASNSSIAVAPPLVISIEDNDTATLGIANAPLTFSEGDGEVAVTLELGAILPADLEVTVTSADGTAIAGSDYTALNRTVTISKGDTSATVTLALLQDAVAEGTETFELGIAASAPGLMVNTPATLSITDDDSIALSVGGAPLSVSEGDGSVGIPLELAVAAPVKLEVTVSFVDGTATAGSDYTALNQTVTMSIGHISTTVSLEVLQDSIVEGAESLELSISASADGLPVMVVGPRTVTIEDDDSSTLRVRGAPLSFSERDGSVTVTLELSAALPADLEVTVNSADGTAIAGSDYTALNQTVTISGGDTSASVTLALLQDSVEESTETIALSLSASAAGLTVAAGTTVRIRDDDGLRLRVAGAPLTVPEGGGGVRVPLELRKAYAEDLEVRVISAGITATVGSDYVALSETVTIGAGDTSAAVTLVVVDDVIVEGNEQLRLFLSVDSAPPGLILESPVLVNISDDEGSTLSVAGTPLTMSEGDGDVSITLELSTALPSDLRVTINAVDGTATAGSDYDVLTLNVVMAAGITSAEVVALGVIDDAIAEGTETFDLSLKARAGGLTVAAPTTVSIRDNDSASLSVRGAPLTVSEGDGDVSLTLELSALLSRDLDVAVRSSGDTAVAGSDYTELDKTVTIPAGSTSVDVTLVVMDDALAEDDETLGISLSASAFGLTVAGSATVSIRDNDMAGISSSQTGPITMGEGDSASYSLVLSSEPQEDVTITLSSDSPSLVSVTASLTFTSANWNEPQEVTVEALQDGDDDSGDAEITYAVTGYGSVGLPPQAVSVTDDDTPAVISTGGEVLRVTEGETVRYTLALATQPSGAVTITLSNDSPALISVTDSLAFSNVNWNTPQEVAVEALQDYDGDSGEAEITYAVTGYGSVGLPPQAVSVSDDDTLAVVSTGGEVLRVTEGETVRYTLALASQPSGAVTITMVSDSPLMLRVTGSLTFTSANWNVPQEVVVEALQDADADSGTAEITTTYVVPSYISVPQPTQAVLVIDDDAATMFLSSSLVIGEGVAGAVAELTLELSGDTLGEALPVTLSAVGSGDNPATVGAVGTSSSALYLYHDLALAASTVTIAAGARSAIFAINLNQDAFAEGTETFELSLSVGDVANVEVVSPVTLSIEDDDSYTLGVVNAPLTISEGSGKSFRVEVIYGDIQGEIIEQPLLSQEIRILVQSVDVTTNSDDYSAKINQIVTIGRHSELSDQVSFFATDDDIVEDSEQLHLVLSIVSGPMVDIAVESPAVVTIIDNDSYMLSVRGAPLSFPEGAGMVDISLGLNDAMPDDLEVAVSTVDGTATAGSDYTALDKTVTIPAGATSAVVSIEVLQDSIVEASETFEISLSASADRLTVSPAASVTVTDDDTGGITSSQSGTITVDEGDSVSYSLVLDAEPSGEVTITMGNDSPLLVSVTSSLIFTGANWNEPQEVTVEALQDADATDGIAVISYAVDGYKVDNAALDDLRVHVRDIPGAVMKLVADAAYDSVTLSWNNPNDSDLVGTWVTYGGSRVLVGATAGTSGSHIVVGLDDDTEYTFVVRSLDGVGNESVPVSVEVTTPAVPAATGLYIASPGIAEAVIVEGGAGATVTVDLVSSVLQDVTVTLAASVGAGYASAEDFAFGSGVIAGAVADTYLVTVPAGAKSSSFTITAVNDGERESYEIIGLEIRDGIAAASLSVIIEDGDGPGVTSTIAGSLSVTEGEVGSYELVLDTRPPGEVVIGLSSGSPLLRVTGSLSFTRDNWDQPQAVMVEALEDADTASETVAISYVVNNYHGVKLSPQEVIIEDDDQAGVAAVISTGGDSLSVTEGGSGRYLLALAAEPPGVVTITLSSSEPTLARVTDSLSFARSNWSEPQAVTVTALEDANTRSETIVISYVVSGYHGVKLSPQEVIIEDNDQAGVAAVISTGSDNLQITEGGSISYSLALTTEPVGEVVVELRSGDPSAVRIFEEADLGVYFNETSWHVPAEVVVAAVEDDDAYSEVVEISYVVYGYGGVTLAAQKVTIVDNDTAGITSTGGEGVSVEEGASGEYFLALETEPATAVIIELRSADPVALAVSPASMEFTAANWNQQQKVTVEALPDENAYDESVTINYTVRGYDGVTLAPQKVTMTDRDTARITSTGGASLVVLEGGVGSYTLAMDTKPSGTVMITLSSSDPATVTVAPATLTFKVSDWDFVRTVRVTAVEDGTSDTATISYVVSGGDHDGVMVEAQLVSVVDNDTAGISTTSDAVIAVAEGDAITYSLALHAEPSAAVTVTLSSSDQSALMVTGSVTFARNAWDVPQEITVTAVHDPDANDEDVSISYVVSGEGSGYESVALADQLVRVTDDDAMGVSLSAIGTVNVREGDTGSYTLVLDTEPLGDVTITLSSDNTDAVTVSPSSLSFSSSNWHTAQTATVTAVQDADATAESASISHVISGGGYDSVALEDQLVYVMDDEAVGISGASGSMVVTEGTVGSYMLALTSRPSAEVVVTLSSSDNSVATVAPSSFTFNGDNWSSPQEVRVTGVADADADDENVIISHSVSSADGAYDGLALGFWIVNVKEDEVATMGIQGSATVIEGDGSVELAWKLDKALPEMVEVMVSVGVDSDAATVNAEAADYRLSATSFTISPGVVEGSISITVEDDDVVESYEVFTVSIGSAANGINLAGTTSVVTIIDNDFATLSIQSAATVAEGGGSVELTWNLDKVLPETVEITVAAGGASGGGAAAEATLDYLLQVTSFNVTAGETTGKLSVAVVADDLIEGDELFTVTIGAAVDYVVSGAAVSTVTITDDDVATLSIQDASFTEQEFSGGSITLELDKALDIDVEVSLSFGTDADPATADARGGRVIRVGYFISDYLFPEHNVVVIEAGARTRQLELFIAADAEDEENEVFTVSISTATSGVSVSATAAVATMTIIDHDTAGVVPFEGFTLIEDWQIGHYRLIFTSVPTASVAVTVHNPDTGAVRIIGSSNDGVSREQTEVIYTPRETPYLSARIGILPVRDTDAKDESVVLTYTVRSDDPKYDGIEVAPSTFTVIDVDAVTVDIDTAPGRVAIIGENAGVYNIPLKLSEVRAVPTTLTIEASNHGFAVVETGGGGFTYVHALLSVRGIQGRAIEGMDFRLPGSDVTVVDQYTVSIPVTIPAFTTELTVPITIVDDDDREGRELFSIEVINRGLVETRVRNSTRLIVIDDNEPPPGFVFSPLGALRVAEHQVTELSVRLVSQPDSNSVSVAVENPDAGAVALEPEELIFTQADWNTPKVIRITGVGDIDLDDELVSLSFRASSADSTLYAATVRVEVADDDTARLSISSNIDQVVAEGAGQVQLVLSVDPVVAYPVELTVTAGDSSGTRYGTAYPGQDYSLPDMITIPAGRPDYTLTIPILDDNVAEPREVFEITLSTQTRGVGTVHANDTITITDNDQAAIIVSAQDLSVTEGSSVEYTVRLAAAAPSMVDLAIVSSDVSAVAVEPAALSFSPSNWNMPQVVKVTGVVDSGIGNETATIRHEISTGDLLYAKLAPPVVTVSTVDRDVVLLSLEQAVSVAEDATQLLLTLRVSPPVDYQVYVNVSTAADSDGSTADATVGRDYSPPNSKLVIEPGASSKAFAIAINEDDTAEGDETFTVSLSSATSGVASEHDYTTVTIADNDRAELIMSPPQFNVAEGGASEYEVQLASMPSQWVSVLISSSEPDVVTTDVSLLVFTQDDWDVARKIVVTAAEDIDSVDESATLAHEAISSAWGYSGLGASSVSVTVNDNDISTLSVSDTAVVVAEDAAKLELPLSLSSAVAEAVAVNVVAIATSATAGLDYVPLSAPVTIAPGASSGKISLAILDDAVAETDEVLLLRITTPVAGVSVATAEVEVTIRDNDPARLVLSETSFVLAEGGSASYNVSLLNQPDAPVQVRIALTASGDSVAGSVTSRMPITFTVDNWNVAQTVSFAIHDDVDHSGGEIMLTHVATGGSYAAAAPVVVAARVVDDDYASDIVYVSAPSVMELSEDFGSSGAYSDDGEEHLNSLTLQVSRPLTGTLFLNATIRDGDPADGGVATSGSDYVSGARNGKLLWSIGPERRSRPWFVIDDSTAEGDESFILSFAASGHRPDPRDGINVTRQQVVLVNAEDIRVVIKDNDVVELSIEDVQVLENAGHVYVPLSYKGVDGARLPKAGLSVLVSTHDGTATGGSGKDYGILHNHELLLRPNTGGVANGLTYIEVPIYQSETDGDREFTIGISSSNSSVRILDGVSTVTIYDAAVNIRIMDQTVSESDGSVPLSFALDAPLSRPLRLTLSGEDGLAARGLDYTLVATEVAIPAGVARYTTVAPVVSIIDDSTVELSGKDFFITAAAADGASLLVNVEGARIDIMDADSSEVTVLAVLQEGLSDSRLEFALAGAVEVPLVISYELAALPGMPAPQDIVMGSFSIDVGAHQDVIRLSVAIEDDAYTEGDESFYLSINDITVPAHDSYDRAQLDSIASKVAIALASQRQQVAVVDNDRALAVTMADVTVAESQILAAVAPQIQSAPRAAVDVRVTTKDGTAVAGRDYVELDYVVPFGPRQQLLPTIYVRIIDNVLVNRNSDFNVDLSVGEGDEVTVIASATVTIGNDEFSNISISPALTEVDEDAGGTIRLQILLNRTLSYPLDVTLNITSDSMQQVTQDYSIDATSFSISPGSFSHTAVLTIVDDERRDNLRGEKGNDLIITPVVNDANIKSVSAAMVDIIDDEAGAGTLSLQRGINFGSLVFAESDGEISVTGTLHPARDEIITVLMYGNFGSSGELLPSGSTAAGSEDITLNRYFQAVIASGETKVDVEFGTIKDDSVAENDEHVHIDFIAYGETSGNVPVYVDGVEKTGGGDTQLIIRDNDVETHTLALEDMEVSESAGSVTISLGEAGRRYIGINDSLEVGVRAVIIDQQVEQEVAPASLGKDYVIQKPVIALSGRENLERTAPYQISIDIVDDDTYEEDEVIRLQLSLNGSASRYIKLPEDNTVDITIKDDDSRPTLIITELAKGIEGAQDAELSLELETPVGHDVTVTVTTSDGTAVAGSDYVAYSQKALTIPAGMISATVKVDIIDDDIVDPANGRVVENFFITFLMSENYQFKLFKLFGAPDSNVLESRGIRTYDGIEGTVITDVSAKMRMQIDDNDVVIISGSADAIVAYEGTDDVIMLPIELSQPLQHEVRATVSVTLLGGRLEFVDGDDEVSISQGSIIITLPPGTQSKSVALKILDDDEYYNHFDESNIAHYRLTSAFAYDAQGEKLFVIEYNSSASSQVIIIDDDYTDDADERSLIRAVNIYTDSGSYALDTGYNYNYKNVETDVFLVDQVVPNDVMYVSVIAVSGATINVNGAVATSNMSRSPPITLGRDSVRDVNIEVRRGHDVTKHNIRILYNLSGTLPVQVSLLHPDGEELKERSSKRVIMRLQPPPPVDVVLRFSVDSTRVVNTAIDGLPLLRIYSDAGEEYKAVSYNTYELPIAANQGFVTLELRAPDYHDLLARELTMTLRSLAVAGATIYSEWPLSGEMVHRLATILPLTATDGTKDLRSLSIEKVSDTKFRLKVSPPPDSSLQVNLSHSVIQDRGDGKTRLKRGNDVFILVDEAGNVVNRDATGGEGTRIMYPAGAEAYDLQVYERSAREASVVRLTLEAASGDYAIVANSKGQFQVGLQWTYDSIRFSINLVEKDIVVRAGDTVPLDFLVISPSRSVTSIDANDRLGYEVISHGGDRSDYKITAPGFGDATVPALLLNGRIEATGLDRSVALLEFVSVLDNDTEEEVYEFRLYGSSSNFRTDSIRIGRDRVVRITVKPAVPELGFDVPGAGPFSVSQQQSAAMYISSTNIVPAVPVPVTLLVTSSDGTPVQEGDYALEWGGSTGISTEYKDGVAVNSFAVEAQVSVLRIKFKAAALAGYGSNGRDIKLEFVSGAESVELIRRYGLRRQSGLITVVP